VILFSPLPQPARDLLDGIPALVDRVFPVPARFRSALPADTAELSRLLTSGRGERGLSYLGRPSMLSAYLRFFLPWNLYRLCRLLPGLDISLAANDRVTDLGCGPLTLEAALWISRPDLRSVPLEFYCVDRSGPVLEAGRKFFAALAGEGCPWKTHSVKGDLETVRAKPAALVCAVNVFNEMYGDISRSNAGHIRQGAEKSAGLLAKHGAASAAFLTVEPGFPRCGEFISLLRGELLKRGFPPVSPCPHCAACPFPGGMSKTGKNRWCHFAFETEDAPAALHRLSQAAGLPKERAVLSFLLAGASDVKQAAARAGEGLSPAVSATRIISDSFPLPQSRFGRYGCSQQGLVLLAGAKELIEKTASGSLVQAAVSKDKKDPKSGALLAQLS